MKTLQGKKPANLIKQGDLLQLGDHLLLCGDATDGASISKLLKGQFISLVCLDPPYGVAYVESKQGLTQGIEHRVIANDQLQTEEEYTLFTQKWLSVLVPHLAKKNAAYIFNSDKMLFALREGIKQAGFHFAQLLIWVKTQAVVGRLDYLPQHELIAYGWHGTHAFKKAKDKSVLVYPKPSRSKLHPTMKPVGLIRRLILNSTDIGDIVFDCFGGSGTTLIACEQTKRKCIMVEQDPRYCQTIIKRWEALSHRNHIKL